MNLEFSREHPAKMALDSECYLVLRRDNFDIACSGLSYGLEDYYFSAEYLGEDIPADVAIAINRAEDMWGVTQIQTVRGTQDLRKGVDYRGLLMQALLERAENERIIIDFFLPANLNYYVRFRHLEDMEQMRHPIPSEGIFRFNYDQTAERFGFELDTESGLFLRK